MKNRTQMRTDIRSDLKDSSTLWSNDELNRCIERAVSDFNRYLPDEKIYELTLDFGVDDEAVTFPATADADRIVDGADISATVSGGTLTITAQPDVPRPVKMTITDANSSVTKLVLIVKGFDKDGVAIEETLYYYVGAGVVSGSRYFKSIWEVEVDVIAGNGAADVLDLGIGAYTDVWVYIANKPIEDGSDSGVDASSNTLTRDTDYLIDYIGGAVKAISGGDISAGEACTFDYTKSQIGIDLSGVTDLIRVQRVEYPTNSIPQSFIPGDAFGKRFFVTGMGESEEQQSMSEGDHIRIYYDAVHIPPNDYVPGTIPEFLENTVVLVAEAYALLIKGLQYEHQAVTDFASARTELTTISRTAWGTALTNAAGQFAAVAAAYGAKTAYITGALTGGTAPLVLAEAALAKVITYLENNTNEDSKYWLTKITTDIAGLRTAILTALDAANAYLDDVAKATTGDLILAAGVWTDEVKHILTAAGIPNAEDFLETYDDKINLVNKGDQVAEEGRMYAETSLNMARAWAQKRADFLSIAGRRAEAAYYYTIEASQRLANLRTYIDQADAWGKVAERFEAQAAQYIADASIRIRAAEAFVNDAASLVGAGNGYIAEAQSRQDDIQKYIDTADRYIATANYNMTLADKFKADAYERRNEVYSIWRDRKTYMGDFTASSTRQMPKYSND